MTSSKKKKVVQRYSVAGRFSLDSSANTKQERPSSAPESERDSSSVNEIAIRGNFTLKQLRLAKSRGSSRVALKTIQHILDDFFSKNPIPSEYRPPVKTQVNVVKEVMFPQVTILFRGIFLITSVGQQVPRFNQEQSL